jgi:hypothetical protein
VQQPRRQSSSSSRWCVEGELHGCHLLSVTLMMTFTTRDRISSLMSLSLSPRLSTKVEDCIKHIQLSVPLQHATVSCTGQIINIACICFACSSDHSNEHSCSIKGVNFLIIRVNINFSKRTLLH